jgi:hypothetical protein
MSNYARIGGILTILSGIWFIFPFMGGVFYALMPQFMEGFMANQPPVTGEPNLTPEFFMFFTIMGLVFCFFSAVLGALAITGGVFALKKRYWAVAVAGAAAGTILFYPCGIAGTILVSLGRPEFAAGRSASPLE